MKSFLTLRRAADTLGTWRAFELSMDTNDNPGIASDITTPEPVPAKTRLWPEVGAAGHWAVIVALGALILLTFANTLHNTGFALDNKFILLEDPRLRDNKPENIQQIFQQDYWWPKAVSGLYRPLTTLSYMVNYTVFGDKDTATGYHVVNFLIHWVNAILVYLLVLILMEKLWPALFVAAIFATHPVVTESVTNIIGRADLFATLTVLLGFVVYAKSTTVNEEPETNWLSVFGLSAGMAALVGFSYLHRFHLELLPVVFQSVWWVVGCITAMMFLVLLIASLTAGVRSIFWLLLLMLVTIVGVFCKESAVVVLGVMLLYDFTYRLQKLHPNWFVNLVQNFWGFFWKGYIALVPPFLALWYVRSWVFDQLRPPELPFVDNPLVGVDFLSARLTAIKVLGKYLWLLVWPQTLSCDYSYNQIPIVSAAFSSWEDLKTLVVLGILVGLIVLAIYNYRRNKAIFFFIMFFFGTLLPTANILKIIGSIMAERFLYLPSLGFAGVIVVLVYVTCRRFIPRLDISAWSQRIWLQVVARGVLALVVLAFAARSFKRNYDWEDDVSLWTQAVDACPNSFKTHKSLAYALYEKDTEYRNIDRIIDEGEKAAQITDKTQIVFLHLGAYYRIKGDLVAQHTADGSLIASPASLPWYQKSVATLERAIPLDHEFNGDNRRKELLRGRKPEEIPDIGNHEIYWNLGLSHMRLGNYVDALKAYQAMAHLAPANPDSYQSIASAYISAGRNEEAAITLLQALLLDGNRQEALRYLVEIYKQIDRDGCALIFSPGHPVAQLNADCALVKTHICRAYANLNQTFLDAKQPALAKQTRDNALNTYKCDAALFNPPAVTATK